MKHIPDPLPCGDAPECNTCRRWAEMLASLDSAELELRLLAPLHPDPTVRDMLWRLSSDLTGSAIKLATLPWRHA